MPQKNVGKVSIEQQFMTAYLISLLDIELFSRLFKPISFFTILGTLFCGSLWLFQPLICSDCNLLVGLNGEEGRFGGVLAAIESTAEYRTESPLFPLSLSVFCMNMWDFAAKATFD